MNKYKKEQYKGIDVYIDESNNYWLSMIGLAQLYQKSKSTISRVLGKVEKNSENATPMQHLINHQTVELYGEKQLTFMDDYFGSNEGINLINHFKNCNIVTLFGEDRKARYHRDNIDIEVIVSTQENTVWITQKDITVLFNSSRQNISHHIKEIYHNKELDKNSVSKKYLHTGLDGKTYSVSYYNLDMIISVGFRVNSSSGIMFRRWALTKLKDLMINRFFIDGDNKNVKKANI